MSRFVLALVLCGLGVAQTQSPLVYVAPPPAYTGTANVTGMTNVALHKPYLYDLGYGNQTVTATSPTRTQYGSPNTACASGNMPYPLTVTVDLGSNHTVARASALIANGQPGINIGINSFKVYANVNGVYQTFGTEISHSHENNGGFNNDDINSNDFIVPTGTVTGGTDLINFGDVYGLLWLMAVGEPVVTSKVMFRFATSAYNNQFGISEVQILGSKITNSDTTYGCNSAAIGVGTVSTLPVAVTPLITNNNDFNFSIEVLTTQNATAATDTIIMQMGTIQLSLRLNGTRTVFVAQSSTTPLVSVVSQHAALLGQWHNVTIEKVTETSGTKKTWLTVDSNSREGPYEAEVSYTYESVDATTCSAGFTAIASAEDCQKYANYVGVTMQTSADNTDMCVSVGNDAGVAWGANIASVNDKMVCWQATSESPFDVQDTLSFAYPGFVGKVRLGDGRVIDTHDAVLPTRVTWANTTSSNVTNIDTAFVDTLHTAHKEPAEWCSFVCTNTTTGVTNKTCGLCPLGYNLTRVQSEYDYCALNSTHGVPLAYCAWGPDGAAVTTDTGAACFAPTVAPTFSPSQSPSHAPSSSPTFAPTFAPTHMPCPFGELDYTVLLRGYGQVDDVVSNLTVNQLVSHTNCAPGGLVPFGEVCGFDGSAYGLLGCGAAVCNSGGVWNTTEIGCVGEEPCAWGAAEAPTLVPLPLLGNQSVDRTVISNCTTSTVDSGVTCTHTALGYNSCANRTCVRGVLYPVDDPGVCYVNNCTEASLSEHLAVEGVFGLWDYSSVPYTNVNASVTCGQFDFYAHGKLCNFSSPGYVCSGYTQCEYGEWQQPVALECTELDCLYNATTMTPDGANVTCVDGTGNIVADGSTTLFAAHNVSCSVSKEGYDCVPVEPLVCAAGHFRVGYQGETFSDWLTTHALSGRDCSAATRCDIADATSLHAPDGSSGATLVSGDCLDQNNTASGEGGECSFTHPQYICDTVVCTQGDWNNTDQVLCPHPKGCLLSNQSLDISIGANATNCTIGSVLPNGTICAVEAPSHECEPLVCAYGAWLPATSTCVSTKCPYTNHTSFTPESATSSNCSGLTSLEHGQVCSFDRPNYDCSGTEIVCGDDNTITNYPAATNGFLLQECAPLNCTFDTATMSPPGATSTNCTNTSTVLHGESCGFERAHYTCSSVLCYEGHVSSPAPCVPDPCVWDDAILPEQAASNCTVVGLQNHTLPSGSICTVYAAGYDCGDPLHCVAGRWWHYPYTSPTDATIYFNDGVFAGTVFPESDTNRIVSPRCDTPVCTQDQITLSHTGVSSNCTGLLIYAPETAEYKFPNQTLPSTCEYSLQGYATAYLACVDGLGWETNYVTMTPLGCDIKDLSIPNLLPGDNTTLQSTNSSVCLSSLDISVSHGHVCGYLASGYTCQETQCSLGDWTNPAPTCTPNSCVVNIATYPSATANGQDVPTDCVNGSVIAHGDHCTNYYPGHTCPHTLCDRGVLLSPEGECSELACPYAYDNVSTQLLSPDGLGYITPNITCTKGSVVYSNNDTLLPSRTTCDVSAEGYQCTSPECVTGLWDRAFQCTPTPCDYADVAVPTGAVAGANATIGSIDCSSDATQANGTVCGFTLSGHDCTPATCAYGVWSTPVCLPRRCTYPNVTVVDVEGNPVSRNCTPGDLVASGQTCHHHAPGHTCSTILCHAETFDTTDPVCLPNGCPYDLLQIQDLPSVAPGADVPPDIQVSTDAGFPFQTECQPGNTVPHGGACQFHVPGLGYDCAEPVCLLGNWSNTTVGCTPRPCNYTEHHIQQTNTTCTVNQTYPPGQACYHSLPGYSCQTTYCEGEEFRPVNPSCDKNPCSYRHSTNKPIGADSSCPDGQIGDGVVCTHNRTGYVCESVVCGTPVAGQLNSSAPLCHPNGCPVAHLASVTSDPASAHVGAVPLISNCSTTIESGDSCWFNATVAGVTCESISCHAGVLNATQPMCFANPCQFNASELDSGATSSCLDQQFYGHGHVCTVQKAGHSCSGWVCEYGEFISQSSNQGSNQDSNQGCTPLPCDTQLLESVLRTSEETQTMPVVDWVGCGGEANGSAPHGAVCDVSYAAVPAQKWLCPAAVCHEGQWFQANEAMDYSAPLSSTNTLTCVPAGCPHVVHHAVTATIQGSDQSCSNTTLVHLDRCTHALDGYACDDVLCEYGTRYFDNASVVTQTNSLATPLMPCTFIPTASPSISPTTAPTTSPTPAPSASPTFMPTTNTGGVPPYAEQPVETDPVTGKQILVYNISGSMLYDGNVQCNDFVPTAAEGASLATRLLLHQIAQGLPHTPTFTDYRVENVECAVLSRRSQFVTVSWHVLVSASSVQPSVLWEMGLPAIAESVRTRLTNDLAVGINLPDTILYQTLGHTNTSVMAYSTNIAVAHVSSGCEIERLRDYCTANLLALPDFCIETGCTAQVLAQHTQWTWHAPTAAPTPAGFHNSPSAAPTASHTNLNYGIDGEFALLGVSSCDVIKNATTAIKTALAAAYHSDALAAKESDVNYVDVLCHPNGTIYVFYGLAVPATRTDEIVAETQGTAAPVSRIQLLTDFRSLGAASTNVIETVLRDHTNNNGVRVTDHHNSWPRYIYLDSGDDIKVDKLGAFFIVFSAVVFFVGGAIAVACLVKQCREYGDGSNSNDKYIKVAQP